jgi:hypothetical protein
MHHAMSGKGVAPGDARSLCSVTKLSLCLSGSAVRNTLNYMGGSAIKTMARITLQNGEQCGDVSAIMSAYVDGQSQPERAAAVTAHLAGCRSCASLHEHHLQTRRLLNLSEADAWTPPDLRLRIAHAVAEEPVRTRRGLWPAGLLASAAIVAMVAAFTLGAGPAGWTATPAATPQSSPPPVIATTAPSPSSCARLSSRALARCLGVSLQFLPTVLDDARYGRTTTHSQAHHAILSPLSIERQSASLVIHHASVKGGGTGRTSEQGRHGSVPE